ncbi:MAG: hypothetical protein HYW57_05185 [Ignavibacteriales bacterium]|nr:hypothetical protein [Ignavibacteriales bacterium]
MRAFGFGATFLLSFFLSACEEKVDHAPTEREEQLIKASASLLVLHERFGPTTAPDSIRLYHHQLDSILSSHGLTREEFRREFEGLLDSPERLKALLLEISTILQKGVDRK